MASTDNASAAGPDPLAGFAERSLTYDGTTRAGCSSAAPDRR